MRKGEGNEKERSGRAKKGGPPLRPLHVPKQRDTGGPAPIMGAWRIVEIFLFIRRHWLGRGGKKGGGAWHHGRAHGFASTPPPREHRKPQRERTKMARTHTHGVRVTEGVRRGKRIESLVGVGKLERV